jgi:hypothetical protein
MPLHRLGGAAVLLVLVSAWADADADQVTDGDAAAPPPVVAAELPDPMGTGHGTPMAAAPWGLLSVSEGDLGTVTWAVAHQTRVRFLPA